MRPRMGDCRGCFDLKEHVSSEETCRGMARFSYPLLHFVEPERVRVVAGFPKNPNDRLPLAAKRFRFAARARPEPGAFVTVRDSGIELPARRIDLHKHDLQPADASVILPDHYTTHRIAISGHELFGDLVQVPTLLSRQSSFAGQEKGTQ